MAIENWMPVLKAKLEEIEGLEQVHTYAELPGSLQVFPSAVVLTERGAADYSAGGPCIDMTRVMVTIYTAGQILPEALSQAVPFIRRMRDKLAANIKLDNTVEHLLPMRGELEWFEGPGQVDYAGKAHVGIIFRYEVKENVSGDFTVSA